MAYPTYPVKDQAILAFLRGKYPELRTAIWLAGEKDVVEFNVDRIGKGVYNAITQEVIIPPGKIYYSFEYDKEMWILARRKIGFGYAFAEDKFNLKGQKIIYP